MKLRELKEELDQSDRNEIIAYLEENNIEESGYTIRPDGRVDFHFGVDLWQDNSNGIPIKIGKVKGYLDVGGTGITKFGDWMPEEATGIRLRDNHLKSFEGLNGKSKIQYWKLDENPFEDLHNIHKAIPWAESLSFNSITIKKNILGLCMIKGLESLDGNSREKWEQEYKDMEKRKDELMKNKPSVNKPKVEDTGLYPCEMAFTIVGQFIGQGVKGSTQAQRLLLEWDLDDFADI